MVLTGTDAQTERPCRAPYHSDSSDPFRYTPIPPANSQQPIANSQSPFTSLYGEIRPIPSFLEYPRGKSQISTWASKNSSEVSFDSSEVSFHSSEVLFRAHVEIFSSLRGDFEIPSLEFFRPNPGGTNSSHGYGTTLPDYLPHYIGSLVDTCNPLKVR